ncbi:TD and POZ domain-containing protein 5 [Araneus ventricosus]|uniref:TD and POZ domain-containing protein 5 n=1 Tax=Araneus ventricosus TaxID=182803 RepID=A0A4Y2RQB6_ARAVE|nr:TD and POZ domain-containing protein 5 [Araneus ventricosus]
MATCQRKECTFQWEINNLWYCWLKNGERIKSHTCVLDQLEHTRWSLILYPKGKVTEDHVGLYLRRENDIFGPKIIEVSSQLAILDTGGSFLKVKNMSKHGFSTYSISGIEEFATQDEIFGTEKDEFFPRDTLIVQCTVFIEDEVPIMAKYYTSVTNFKTNLRSFFWNIDGFSNLIPDQRNYFQIENESKKILANFYLVSGLKGEITLEIISLDKSLKCFSFKISVIDSERKKVNFGSHKFFGCDVQGIKRLLISREQLMQNESRYLSNDVLSLFCEYAFSTGVILNVHESCDFGIISPASTKELEENEKKPIISQNELHQTQALVDDLKSIYSDGILCDIELRTSTNTFPAHKTILSARSPVFRRMFTNDMREKNSGHVDITDVEDETVRRMLLYIYADVLEDMQFESASKLYSAADKYAVFSLKERCSCFLKDNVNPTKACDLLILADRHQDGDLKCAVQDYILSHDKEVFGSLEWKDFMATNLQLAADIMYQKVFPS